MVGGRKIKSTRFTLAPVAVGIIVVGCTLSHPATLNQLISLHPAAVALARGASGTGCTPGQTLAPTSAQAAAQGCPYLKVRPPGVAACAATRTCSGPCKYTLSVERNGGRPTVAVCLLEGWNFQAHELVHLNYRLSLFVPLAPSARRARQTERLVTTPLPLVTCLMRKPRICRYVQTDGHGHFGPVWLRITYLLGDRDQEYEVLAYGSPTDRAGIILPAVRVVE